MQKVNQQLIAKTLNVSQTTVSRTFSNHPSINPETKALVLDAAARMGYRPSLPRIRKAAREKGQTTIGVIIGMPKQYNKSAETFQYMLKGISDRASVEDIILDVVYQDPSQLDDNSLVKKIRHGKWNGAVLIYPMEEKTVFSLSSKTACVSIVENYRKTLVDSVDVDRDGGIQTLLQHLKDNGHERIGFFTWKYTVPTEWVYSRFGSYVEGLYYMGMDFDPHRIINIGKDKSLTPMEGAKEVAHLLEKGVTAWVCPADHQVFQLMDDLSELGISVPADCSITGFDGIETMPAHKKLTTIRVPYEEMGRSAINQLIRRIEHPTAPRRHIQVDGEFVRGQTVARIRNTATNGVHKEKISSKGVRK